MIELFLVTWDTLFNPVYTRWGALFAAVVLITFYIMMRVKEKKHTEKMIEQKRKEKKEQEDKKNKED